MSAVERCKIVTCVLPSGRALQLLEMLRSEHGVTSAYAHHARDVTIGRASGVGEIADESEAVTLLVPEARADEMFEVLCRAVGLDAPGSGIVFMERALLARASAAPAADAGAA